MALQLFKLASEKFPAISATTSQAAHAYFRRMTAAVTIGAGVNYSFRASRWQTETGGTVASFATGQGLKLLSINAVLQQPGLYAVNSNSVVITGPTGGITLSSNYPITLQTYNTSVAMTVSALASSRIAIP